MQQQEFASSVSSLSTAMATHQDGDSSVARTHQQSKPAQRLQWPALRKILSYMLVFYLLARLIKNQSVIVGVMELNSMMRMGGNSHGLGAVWRMARPDHIFLF